MHAEVSAVCPFASFLPSVLLQRRAASASSSIAFYLVQKLTNIPVRHGIPQTDLPKHMLGSVQASHPGGTLTIDKVGQDAQENRCQGMDSRGAATLGVNSAAGANILLLLLT